MAENKLLDDLAKFGNSTITAMNGIQRQVRSWASEQVESMIDRMELVNRKELQVALDKIEVLEKRLNELEVSTGKKAAKTDSE